MNTVNLTIMGRRISVCLLSEKEMKEAVARGDVKIDEDADLQAWFSPRNQTIYISRELTPFVFRRTLIHEMTHAMLSISGLTHLITSEQEEAICDLSENWLDVMNSKEFCKLAELKRYE